MDENTSRVNYNILTADLIKLWNAYAKEEQASLDELSTLLKVGPEDITYTIYDLIANNLNRKEWRKFRYYWHSLKTDIAVGLHLVTSCSNFYIKLPFKISQDKYQWDASLERKFWEEVFLIYFTESEDIGKSGSKKAIVWKTEGNPDTYDIDKVLEDLGEVVVKPKKKKPKDKKTKKSKTISNGSTGTQDTSEGTDLQNATSENNQDQVTVNKELSNPSEHEYPKSIEDSSSKSASVLEQSSSEFNSVGEYIDSLEQEIRCLKLSQQFYNSLEAENQKLKKAYDNMNRKFDELIESRLCKVCMDEEACIVFVPCDHLMSCINCSPSLKNCAICRRPVKSTRRVYFS